MHERVAVSTAELDDLDLDALDRFLAARLPGASRDDAGIKLGLLAKAASRTVPTVAGLYLFGKAPQLAMPEWGLVAVAFAGPTLASAVRERDDAEGGVASLLERGLAFARRHASASGPGGGEYAEPVVREALANALVHRELRRTSRPALRVFDDRLEIWSPGGPPEGLGDLEELAREGGVSQPRNPIVASVARALGVGEQLGRGLLLLTGGGAQPPESSVEIRATPRDVLVVIPSRWPRPPTLS